MSVGGEDWEPGVAVARVRDHLGGLGLTRFWPGEGVSSLHRACMGFSAKILNMKV